MELQWKLHKMVSVKHNVMKDIIIFKAKNVLNNVQEIMLIQLIQIVINVVIHVHLLLKMKLNNV